MKKIYLFILVSLFFASTAVAGGVMSFPGGGSGVNGVDTEIRYINTGSTAGGNGTTNATSGDNRAYATITEWEADEQKDYVTLEKAHHVYLSGATNDDTHFGITGSTTNATYFITMTGDADGKWDDSHFTFGGATGDYMYGILSQDYTIFENIQWRQPTSNNSNFLRISGSGLHATVRNCLFRGLSTSGSSMLDLRELSIPIIYNNVFYEGNTHAIRCEYLSAGSKIYNNSIFNTNLGIWVGNGTDSNITIFNNVSIGNTTDFTFGSAVHSYNASSDSTATGTGAVTSATAVNNFTAAATGDFTIVDTDADIYDAGTSTGAPSTDISGTTRTTDDIGAWGY